VPGTVTVHPNTCTESDSDSHAEYYPGSTDPITSDIDAPAHDYPHQSSSTGAIRIFGCTQIRVSGVVGTIKAAYVLAVVSLASDLTHGLNNSLSQMTSQYYSMTMNIPPQPLGTHLIVSVGQWDGANYVEPATMLRGDCVAPLPTLLPTMSPTNLPTVAPTMILTAMPTQAGVGQVSISAICSGVTIQGTSDKSQITVELDSIDNGLAVIGPTHSISPRAILVTTSFFHPPFRQEHMYWLN